MAHCAEPIFHCMLTPRLLHTAIQNEKNPWHSAAPQRKLVVDVCDCVCVRR